MAKRPGRYWGLWAALCAIVLVAQIYGLATDSLFPPGDVDASRYAVIGLALAGLVAALAKLVVEP